jgi:hypothetical protein
LGCWGIKRSNIFLVENGERVKLPNGKFKRVSEIITPGGVFPEGNDLIKTLASIATYVDHPQRWELLMIAQHHYNVSVGSLSLPGTTRVSSVHKLLLQSLLFYWYLQCFCEERSMRDTNEDQEFVRTFLEITEEEWATVQEV